MTLLDDQSLQWPVVVVSWHPKVLQRGKAVFCKPNGELIFNVCRRAANKVSIIR